MPDEFSQLLRRVDMTERNHTDLAKSVTALTENLDELRIDRARREERDIRVTERFDRIEKRLDGIYKLGWWVLGAFGASAIALIVNFVFRGGFIVK